LGYVRGKLVNFETRFEFRVSSFEFRVSSFEFRVSRFEIRDSRCEIGSWELGVGNLYKKIKIKYYGREEKI
jgi:hypothetical protein